MQVSEGLPSGTVVGTLMAKDPDEGENGTVYYSLSGRGSSLFTFSLLFSLIFAVYYSAEMTPFNPTVSVV